jgi:hypothetical protein
VIVSITRLRVRAWRYLPVFFLRTLSIARQASAANGNVAVALLRDRRNAFWTGTVWSDEAAMKAFMHAPPHGPTMRRLLDWCDEAALVHWTQDRADPPTWEDAHRRLEQDGRPSKVHYPSDAHNAHRFPPPTARRTAQVRLK